MAISTGRHFVLVTRDGRTAAGTLWSTPERTERIYERKNSSGNISPGRRATIQSQTEQSERSSGAQQLIQTDSTFVHSQSNSATVSVCINRSTRAS